MSADNHELDQNESTIAASAKSANEFAEPYLIVESHPQSLVAACYADLPFPTPSPIQDIALDVGITARNGPIELTGIVFKGYSGHQLLFEQRWPARIIRQHLRKDDLTIPAGMGLALRSVQFLIHGYEQISMLDVTVVGKRADAPASESPAGAMPPIQAMMQILVRHHEQQTDLHFPLRGSWWAIQAGDWSDQHKQELFSQTYAVDFVKLGAESRFFCNDGRRLEDHYSWDQPVYATAGGKVAFVQFDMPDLAPGTMPDPAMFRGDPRRVLGNAVAISHANGEFSYYGHLKQLSIAVNDGELIKRGTLIGRVGNSGHSPGPHLHFHSMEGPNLMIDQGLPVKFSHFEAGGQYFEEPTLIPTRMIIHSEISA